MKSGPGKKSPPVRRSLWHLLRLYFRRFRAAVWTLVILAILAALWFNQVGLPEFLKRPLLEKLRARGIELQFTNLRLSWSRGFVAYNVRFGRAADPAAPQFSARCVEVPLNSVALRHFDFEIGGLALCDALVRWPINETNQPLRELTVTNLNATVHFLPDDKWRLDNFSARVAGARLSLNGELTHASAIRNWRLATATAGPTHAATRPRARVAAPDKLRTQLRQFDDALRFVIFSRPPGLRLSVYGDARDFNSFKFAASFAAAEAITPLGAFTDTRLTVRTAGFSQATTNSAAPGLTFVRLQTRLDGGDLDLAANFDSATRELRFNGASGFDLHRTRPLLPPKASAWLERFSWEQPPQIRFNGAVTLPPWTNRPPDWGGAVLAGLQLNTDFKVGPAAFRGVPVLAAASHLTYSNHVWRLPDLQVTRPEGRLRAVHWTDTQTRDYYWHLQGAVDPKCVRPLLEPGEQHALDLVGFTTPPEVDVEIWSRWLERERTGVKGRVAMTNFTFRGETGGTLQTAVEYTNLWLHLAAPRVTRGAHGEQRGALTSVDVDFRTKMLYLTNGNSTIDPMVIARAVGEKTTEALAPYEFLQPPTAHMEGAINVGGEKIADLRVHVSGGPFHWWKFNVPQIAGDVHWRNQSLLLTNVTGEFYSGSMEGMAAFDFTPKQGNEFNFEMRTTDASLAPLLADLTGNSNRLEGRISGQLLITRANTHDIMSWQGRGDVTLHNGLLWEIPVFGVFTPVLNTFWPNLGSGRASEGAATFTITNSVVRSDNLELRSPMARLQYRGTVDFTGNIAARVEAEPLRDTWVIGPVVSTMLRPISKALEFKVTGNLNQPKAEPVYLPKFFLIPFSPLQSLRELFTDKPAVPPQITPLPAAQ